MALSKFHPEDPKYQAPQYKIHRGDLAPRICKPLAL